MAARFGENLLLEVHEEGLDELLHDLSVAYRENVADNTARFGIAPIDELMNIAMPSAQPIHNQPVPEEGDTNDQVAPPAVTAGYEPAPSLRPIKPAFTNRPYPVLEISSISSAAGKTHMLYYFTALAVLPSEIFGLPLGGFNSAVVFIDADGRFDAERLRVIARGVVREKAPASLDASGSSSSLCHSIETMLLGSLQHVHVFRPQSSLALLATLQSLDAYLLDLPRHVSSDRPLHSIILDSATAFFWQDKLRDEIARTEEIGRPAAEIEEERIRKESFYLADVYADLVTELKRLQHSFDCAVIYTAISFTGRSMEKTGPSTPYGSYNPLDTAFPNMPSFRSPLPPPWGLFPSLRLILQPDVVRPFAPSLTVSEAKKDAPMRQEVVARGEFWGSINGWGREDWPRRILDELKRRDAGQFSFQIVRDGVTFG